MNIHLVLVLPSGEGMQKTYRSTIRPVAGDVIDDPGFDPAFHNGYEVVKVTLNYASEECWVSLAPLAIEVQYLGLEAYVEKLRAHGWKAVSREV
ncbi:hypothetical protein ACE6ED_23055 [Paenibacillus sp. CN-4]|uniref:hypothetical protein n=1 Tax=Paenibacillus nanchangensis TaxID=3348343 RepID=UPI00397E3F88